MTTEERDALCEKLFPCFKYAVADEGRRGVALQWEGDLIQGIRAFVDRLGPLVEAVRDCDEYGFSDQEELNRFDRLLNTARALLSGKETTA